MDKKIFLKRIKELMNYREHLYIYGAGLYGQNIYKSLKKAKINVDGFIVSNSTDEETILDTKPIFGFNKKVVNDALIILGVNRHNALEIEKMLFENGIDEKWIIKGYEFIDNEGIRGGYDEIPTMEITTTVGCKVNCRFCPQAVLLKNYYQGYTDRARIMSLEDFCVYLKKIPDNCTILFSGMAEPFLNESCLDMIEIACDWGFKVDLYTTLVGLDYEGVEKLLSLPIDFMGVHVADKYGLAKISVSDSYYKKLEKIINAKKIDGSPFVNVCNSQSDPDERVSEICGGKYDILSTMLDRAGNLKDDALYKKSCKAGKISCSLCGRKLNHNVILPDGTVLLCCMDYGMKHILGNLKEDTYDSLFLSAEYLKLRCAIDGDDSIDVLCRKCSCANPVL